MNGCWKVKEVKASLNQRFSRQDLLHETNQSKNQLSYRDEEDLITHLLRISFSL